MANVTTDRPFQGIDFCEKPVEQSVENIAYATFMIILLLASVIGNSLVVLASCLSKQLRARVTIYFILSLAVANVLNASVLIPFHVSTKLHYNRFCHSLSVCYWNILGDATTTLASILSMFFIAIDRYIAISFPFNHQSMFSAKNVKMIIIGIWISSALYAITGIFPWKTNKYIAEGDIFSVSSNNNVCVNNNRLFYVVSLLGVYLIPLAIMTFTYSMILKIALTQIRAIESTQVTLQNSSESSPSNDAALRKERIKRIRRKELRATKSVVIVYLSFLVCWMPLFVIVIILELDTSFFPRLQTTNKNLFLFVWYGLIQIFPSVNTMINPVIYFFSNKLFRKGFKTTYKRVLQRFELQKEQLDNCRSQRAASSISLASTVAISTSSIVPKQPKMNSDDTNEIHFKSPYDGIRNEVFQMENSICEDVSEVKE